MSDHDPRIDRSDPVQADAEDRWLAASRPAAEEIVEISCTMPASVRLVAKLMKFADELSPGVSAEECLLEGGPERMVIRVTVTEDLLDDDEDDIG